MRSVGQKRSMMTPCGMYMKPRRTGGLYGAPLGWSAQPMVSINGRASATPRPRRQVRRMMMGILPGLGRISLVHATMGKRITGHDPGDETLHAVIVLHDAAGELIDLDLVVSLQLTAKRVGQQFAGEVAAEIFLARSDDPYKFTGGAEAMNAEQISDGIDRAA